MSFRWLNRLRGGDAPRPLFAKSSGRGTKVRRRLTLDALEDRCLLSTTIPLSSSIWTPIGPAPIGGTTTNNGEPNASGRITGVRADASNPNLLYVATSGGGVWKTTDGGTTWSDLTDRSPAHLPPFIGAIAAAPSDPSIIYAGTGESNFSYDSYAGKGVLKSTDAGASWTLVGSGTLSGLSIARVVVSPTTPNTVYVAATSLGVNPAGTNSSGVYKSVDGGITWVNTTASIQGSGRSDQWTDLVMDPTAPNTLYAADGSPSGDSANAVYKSVNGGQSWAIAGDFIFGTVNGRISLAISSSNPSEVIASIADPNTGGLRGLAKSVNAGLNWTTLSGVPDYLGGGNGLGMGYYANTVAIDPTNANVIYAAGTVTFGSPNRLGIIQSLDGGSTWRDITIDPAGNEPHTMVHGMTFDASGDLLIVTDGGIWKLSAATTASYAWSNLNGNLQITPVVGAALDPTSLDTAYAGARFNGTNKFNDNLAWSQLYRPANGDGGYVVVDPSTPTTLYAEGSGVSLRKSTDGGVTWTPITAGMNTNDPTSTYVPFTLDLTDPTHQRLYAGTYRVYKSTSGGTFWTAVTTPNQNGWNTSAPITGIVVAPTDSATIYVTTSDAHIWVTTNGGATWTQRDVSSVQDSYGQIVVDPANAQTAYVVRNAYNGPSSTGHVFMTTDAGATWSDISGTLPDVPTWSFAIDTRSTVRRIYVGTDQGVYATSIGTTAWSPFKVGLPSVQVVSLTVDPNLDVILAGTHGRGLWEIVASDALSVQAVVPPSGVEGNAMTNVQIATMTDKPLGALNTYTATIDWGDFTGTTTGSIVDLGGGFYGIDGTHVYEQTGNYNVTVSVSGTNGHSGSAVVGVRVNDAPLTPTGTTLNTVVGSTLSASVGSFQDGNPSGTASDFTATIDWGDGTRTTGTVVPTSGPAASFAVEGSHAYKAVRAYTVTTTVNDVDGASTTIISVVNVADAQLTPVPTQIQEVEGSSFTAVVGAFRSENVFAKTTDYSFVIVSWGDGTPANTLASGVALVLNNGQFNVTATHSSGGYHQRGSYPITITVFSSAGQSTVINSTAVVSDAAVSATVVSQSVQEGGTVGTLDFPVKIATILDANPYGFAADLVPGSTVDWGDGVVQSILPTFDPAKPTTPYLVTQGNGRFDVMGVHTYGDEGTNSLVVSVVSQGGQTGSGTGQVTVTDAPITATGNTISGTAGRPVATSVGDAIATFVDAYTAAPLSDFTATINWGDGTPTEPGTVIQPGGVGTTFSVLSAAGHLYPRAGTYPVTVTIVDVGGSTDTVLAKAQISDPAITSAYVASLPVMTQGEVYSGTVATFSNGNPLAVPNDFIVSIDWGDHTQSLGLVAPVTVGGNPTGNFTVTAKTPHAFTSTGVFPVNVSIISLGGQRATASTTAADPTTQATVTVNEPPITDTTTAAMVVTSVAGATYTGIVGSFSEYALAPVTDFTANIRWGDGTESTGTVAVSAAKDGTFTVSGSHAYAQYGSYSIIIDVVDIAAPDPGTATGTLNNTANVSDASLSGQGAAVSTVATIPFTGTVATFTTPNLLAQAGEYTVKINWGDGSALDEQTGVVSGGGGSFKVTGSHNYTVPSTYTTTVTIEHTSPISANPGTILTVTSSARVLTPLNGAMSRASDSGVSNTDGITNITTPVFSGTGEPGASIQVSTGGAVVGTATVTTAGQWSLQVGPQADGAHAFVASMYDPATGVLVQRSTLPVTPDGGSVLLVDTAGPIVAGVTFTPGLGQLQVVFQDGLSGVAPGGLFVPGNFQLAAPTATGLAPYAVRNMSSATAPGVGVVTLNYALPARLRTGVYVVTIRALGITDLAGNTMVEKSMVAFPQTGNSPNPNYIAEFDVSARGTTTGPKQYVSLAEKRAAAAYAAWANANKVVRVPSRPVPIVRPRFVRR